MVNPKRIAKGLYWDRAWSLVEGCSYVSKGCTNCWAAAQAHMRSHQQNNKIRARYEGLTTEEGRWNGQIRILCENLDLPLKRRKPTVWAVWNDLFHPEVPFEFLARVFGHMHSCKQHTFIVLTKRPERMARFISWYRENWLGTFEGAWPKEYPHVWLGVTAENQEQADERIPILLQTPAAVRFVSCEPLLGPMNLRELALGSNGHGLDFKVDALTGWAHGYNEKTGKPKIHRNDEFCRIHWVICGGESGPGARPMHPDWVRNLRDQCQAAGVPFFFKQHGEWRECEPPDQWDSAKYKTTQAHGTHFVKLGKKAAGRLLDGCEWDEMPEVAE
ncbi:DUF5131 family protein [Desulfoscipio geothermicus]|uniref:Protein gp37 n=1 Tax=Desulfoscipio geothermicus DSM 3669 TaxID=1121426 RepID=A0A1I6ECD2_9FIRM|nr:phage Gp37/Gp68 family protein [Desulfoscipio geothermicus]SFR15365.1 protein gp37 [Desulfoscipio geothermicus DSM 3669]